MWGCVVGGAWAYIEGVCHEVDWEGVDGGGGADFRRYVLLLIFCILTFGGGCNMLTESFVIVVV